MAQPIIIKVGDNLPGATAPGDFEHWIAQGMGVSGMRVVDPRRAGFQWPALDQVAWVVITGSHSNIDEPEPEAWIAPLAAWLRQVVEAGKPVLGICFGHQILAHAFGGEVRKHPGGLEFGTRWVELTEAGRADPLLGGCPPRFLAQLTHGQSVRHLPAGAVRLAHNDFEGNQAFRIGERAWGVQFHPEFPAQAVRDHIVRCRDRLADADTLEREITDTPDAAALLRRFADLALSAG